MAVSPSSSPQTPPAVWDLFCTVLTPAWVADWYRTHDLHGGGGLFSPLLTLWLLLNQRLAGRATNEQVWSQLTLAQAQALSPHSRRLQTGSLSPHPSGYSYARQHLPLSVIEAAADLLYQDLHRRFVGPEQREPPLFVLDGSSLTLPHSPALAAAYPPAPNQHGVSHWPVVRLVVAHAVGTGLALRPVWGPMFGPQAVSEQALAQDLLPGLPVGAWVIADSNFGVFSVAWALAQQQQVPVVRLQEARAQKVLGPAVDLAQHGDYAVRWTASRLDHRTSPALPVGATLQGRVVVRHVVHDGEQERLCLFTTAAATTCSAEQLVACYGQRVLIETDLRSLKHSVALESTGVRSPALLAKDIVMAVAAYNVLRWIAAEAAATRQLAPRRISFTRTLHYARAYAPRLAAAPDQATRQQLWGALLTAIAAAPLPLRPRRRFPRQVWRKPQIYPAHRPTPSAAPAK